MSFYHRVRAWPHGKLFLACLSSFERFLKLQSTLLKIGFYDVRLPCDLILLTRRLVLSPSAILYFSLWVGDFLIVSILIYPCIVVDCTHCLFRKETEMKQASFPFMCYTFSCKS